MVKSEIINFPAGEKRMRGNFKSARIRLLGLMLLFLITASGVFAYSAAKSPQAKPILSAETALKAIDFAAENDISIDSEFSANLRQTINFNRNRYYSPALGRFISKDPIGFNGGMNLYRYADNNPIRWIDSFGLLTEAECERLQQEIAKWQGVKPLLVNMFKTYKEGTAWEDYGLKVLSNASGYRSKEFNELPAFIRNVLNERVYTTPNSVLQSLMLGWVGTSMLIGGNIENSLFGQGQTGIVQFWKVWVCMEYYRTNLVVEELTKLYEDDCKEGCE